MASSSVHLQQVVKAMANPVFAASRLGCFVHALCASSPKVEVVDSIFRCIENPPITVHEYAVRLGTYMKCGSSAFVLAAVLVHRLWEKFPTFFCELSSLKILATSCVIAIKFLEDGFFNNAYYSHCAGVTLTELNMMESTFLSCVGFRVFVNPDQFKVAEARLGNIENLLYIPPVSQPQIEKQLNTPEAAFENPACMCNQ
eukprot:c1332_g1_i1.p1 GENE.c1332_g1_i1~~c1332_g1_i1.p1  ORF type:complete len:200 (-),score=37.36 c1332_g1_i1:317-916(-)